MKEYKLNKSFNLWFTGLPSSGKTTTALALKEKLKQMGIEATHLDGDIIRKGLSSDLGFSEKDREENNRRIIYVTQIIVESGVPVLTSFISPYRDARQKAREIISNFVEVFVNTDLKECIRRDVKGLYAKALKGEIQRMTGIDDVYEEPENPDIIINTTEHSLEQNVDDLINFLINRKYITQND